MDIIKNNIKNVRCGDCKWHNRTCSITGKIVHKSDFKCKNFKIK